MTKILITGATGQVGNQMVHYLVKEMKLNISSTKDIICLVRNPNNATNLADLGVTVVKGDLQDNDTIVEIMQNSIDYVFHIAADIDIHHSFEQMYPVNVLGTRIMLDAFVNSSAKYFIFTSSIIVYNVDKKGVKSYYVTEESPIGKAEGSPYATTKRLAETLVFEYCKNYPNKIFIITRLGPIVGPGDRQFLPALIEVMGYKVAPKLIDGGKGVISLTSPHDIVRAQVFLAELGSEFSGEVFNVAQETISFREIMNTIAIYYKKRPPKFSIAYWFFKAILPFLRVLHKIFPKIKLIKNALSPTTITYLGRNYYYKSNKIEQIGFNFIISPREAIIDALEHLDPERKMLKPSKRLKER